MRRYGGAGEDIRRCAANVWQKDGSTWLPVRQCQKQRGNGSDGLLCGRHAGMERRGVNVSIPADREVVA